MGQRAGQLSLDEDVRRMLTGANYAHVATLMRDGSPHVVPVWIDLDGDHLVFVKERDSVAIRNLRRDARLAISLVGADDPFETVYLRGRASAQHEDRDVAAELLERLARRYTGRAYADEMPLELVTVVVLPQRARYRRLTAFSPGAR